MRFLIETFLFTFSGCYSDLTKFVQIKKLLFKWVFFTFFLILGLLFKKSVSIDYIRTFGNR